MGRANNMHASNYYGNMKISIFPAFIMIAILLITGTSGATTYTVDSLDDVIGADGHVTLREAIEAANTNAAVNEAAAGSETEADEINFAPALFASGPATITLHARELTISESLNINGPSRDLLSINVNGLRSVIRIDGYTTFVKITGMSFRGSIRQCIYCDDRSTLVLSNSSVCDNKAIGIYLYFRATARLINTTVVGNNNTGILLEPYASLDITNSTIACNKGIGIEDLNTLDTNPVTINNSIVAMNDISDSQNITGFFKIQSSLINIDPDFVRNHSKGHDNVWGTKDDIQGDYHLKTTSLAIDYGDNALAIDNDSQPLTTDADGNNRIYGSAVDAGAYECQSEPAERESPSTIVTTTVDEVNSTDGVISLREAIVYARTLDQDVSFAADLTSNMITLNGNTLYLYEDVKIDASSIGSFTINAAKKSRVFATDCGNANIDLISLDLINGYTDGDGGGIYCAAGSLRLENTSISKCSAEYRGGGIHNSSDAMTLINSTIERNSASSNGYVIYTDSKQNITINRSTITNNSGGGIYIYQFSPTTISNSSVTNNREGTGIDCGARSTLVLSQSSVCGNSATGIQLSAGTATLINTIVAGNGGEGIIRGIRSWLYLTNSTVACNAGVGIVNDYGPDPITINNSIVAMNDVSNSQDITDAFVAMNSLIGIDPNFVSTPSAGPDELWGTDDDIQGDYHLTASSLAINHGDNALAIDGDGMPLTTDIDGNNRIYGYTVDTGAYEYQSEPAERESPSTVVTTTTDVADITDGNISLREAIFYAEALNQDVSFAAHLTGGVITLNGNELHINKDLKIDASSIGTITIDAANQSRIINTGYGYTNIELINLTLTNGHSGAHGGGIFCPASTLRLENTSITGCSTESYGGGIYMGEDGFDGRSLTLINSTVKENTAGHFGGAIYIGVKRNENSSYMTLINSTIEGNSASAGKYAIYSSRDENITINSSTITNNSGGGIYIHARSAITISNSSITNNREGSGIKTESRTTLNLVNSEILNNSTSDSGGGLYGYNSDIIIINSTFSGNTAEINGGGVYNWYGDLYMENSIVTLNNSPEDIDIYGGYTSKHCLISTDPLFVRNPSAGPDEIWGTSDDDTGDLRLRPDSPAIDTGSNIIELTAEILGLSCNTDVRGADRWVGESVDIGAYEFQDWVADANGDEVVNLDDFIVLKQIYGHPNATKAHGDFNGDGRVDLDDFIILKQNYGSRLIIDTDGE